MAEHLKISGVGIYQQESTIVRAVNMSISKNILESTAYDEAHMMIK